MAIAKATSSSGLTAFVYFAAGISVGGNPENLQRIALAHESAVVKIAETLRLVGAATIVEGAELTKQALNRASRSSSSDAIGVQIAKATLFPTRPSLTPWQLAGWVGLPVHRRVATRVIVFLTEATAELTPVAMLLLTRG